MNIQCGTSSCIVVKKSRAIYLEQCFSNCGLHPALKKKKKKCNKNCQSTLYTLWVSIVLQMLCVVFGMCLGVLTNVLVITVVLLHKKSTSHTNNVFLTHVCKLVRFG